MKIVPATICGYSQLTFSKECVTKAVHGTNYNISFNDTRYWYQESVTYDLISMHHIVCKGSKFPPPHMHECYYS